ncbi:MAG: hypothetical protein ACOVNR_00980 [Chitinophagaceae bacterium]
MMQQNIVYFLKHLKVQDTTHNQLTNGKKLLWFGLVIPIFFSIIGTLLWVSILFFKNHGIVVFTELDTSLKYGIIFELLMVAIIAPLIEEFVFRFPLKYVKKFRIAPFIYFFNVVFFGFVHLFNYNIANKFRWFMPILVSLQLLVGLGFNFY